jgi:hypothetical protein
VRVAGATASREEGEVVEHDAVRVGVDAPAVARGLDLD